MRFRCHSFGFVLAWTLAALFCGGAGICVLAEDIQCVCVAQDPVPEPDDVDEHATITVVEHAATPESPSERSIAAGALAPAAGAASQARRAPVVPSQRLATLSSSTPLYLDHCAFLC